VLLLAIVAASGEALAGYSGNAWVKLVALTVGAQFLGHSLFNRVLRTTSPTVVSLAILFEVPGATLIAAAWLGQRPHVGAIPGLVLLLAGVAAVITARDRGGVPAVPVE
jgi:drug/metabolite transporter (DMT)-like permease